jgi:replicative DNA helicase
LHPGELGIVAAGPKVGKSFFLCWAALSDWRNGRRPALFTLENSVPMMRDRIACLAANVDPSAWWRGECSDDEIETVRAWANETEKEDHPLWILRPDLGGRSLPTMVREAQVREADSVLIDQLTHCELPDPRKPKTERIGDALHLLKGIISQGRDAIPCLLAHQINREGVKMARKVGYHEMEHLADSAEIERTADAVYGMYASPDEVDAYLLRFQTLAARRFPLKHWELTWQIPQGLIAVHSEINL